MIIMIDMVMFDKPHFPGNRRDVALKDHRDGNDWREMDSPARPQFIFAGEDRLCTRTRGRATLGPVSGARGGVADSAVWQTQTTANERFASPDPVRHGGGRWRTGGRDPLPNWQSLCKAG